MNKLLSVVVLLTATVLLTAGLAYVLDTKDASQVAIIAAAIRRVVVFDGCGLLLEQVSWRQQPDL